MNKVKTSLDEALSFIKKAGFSHIKFELEGHLHRQNNNGCVNCLSTGHAECVTCTGVGALAVFAEGSVWYKDCFDCLGDGSISCIDCRGTGNKGNYRTDSVCDTFILNYVSQKLTGKSHAQLCKETKKAGYKAIPNLSYGRFYRDGSVDSEYTFTVPIENARDVLIYIEAFKELAKVAGSGRIETTGAGMHISVLPKGCNGVYPHHKELNREGASNFQNQVTKLLPAIYFLATANHYSRSMGFRTPQISPYEKYSAIYTHENTCLEYRVFETCYNKPEAVFDFIEVIANTLRFYADPTMKVKELKKTFGFTKSNNVAEYFDTTENLKVLNATIKYIKPADKTLTTLKKERGLMYTVKDLSFEDRKRMARLENDYKEMKKHYELETKKPLSASEVATRDYIATDRNINLDEAEKVVKSGRIRPIEKLDSFIAKNLKKKPITNTLMV